MFKGELTQLLNADVINTADEDQIKLLLSLNEKEVNLLLKNLECYDKLMDFFKNCRTDSDYDEKLDKLNSIEIIYHRAGSIAEMYSEGKKLEKENLNFAINTIMRLENEEIVEIFPSLALNVRLNETKYYKYIIEKAATIKDREFFGAFYHVACSPALLKSDESKYYMAVNTVLKSKKELLKKVSNLATNPEILGSKYYEWAINKALEAKSLEQLNELGFILADSDLLRTDCYKYTISKLIEIEDLKVLKLMRSFIDKIILKTYHYKFALSEALKIKDIEILKKYIKLAHEPRILFNSGHYEYIMSCATNIDNTEAFKIFSRIVTNNILLEKAETFNYIVKTASEMDYKLLEQFYKYLIDTYFWKLETFKNTWEKISKISDLGAMSDIIEFIGAYALSDINFDVILDKLSVGLNKGNYLKSLNLIDFIPDDDNRNMFIGYLSSIEDDRISVELGYLCETMCENKEYINDTYQSIFLTLINALRIKKNPDIIIEIIRGLDEIVKQYACEKQNPKLSSFESQLVELRKNTLECNIVTLIHKEDRSTVIKILKALPDDTDITPNTFVKRFNKGE